ncbi:hypothetical protein AB0F42_19755 [Streptomyces buecherae]|uniref:hypothetical protein n=1 Tax=Streptomyces buecherae TaxID=2763006 RepID=UPI0033DAF903
MARLPATPHPDRPSAPVLTTPVPGPLLRALTSRDPDAYDALLDRDREHLGRHGEFRGGTRAGPAWVARTAPPPRTVNSGTASARAGTCSDRVGLVPVEPARYGTGYWLAAAHTGSS